jgi:hypothetical protein
MGLNYPLKAGAERVFKSLCKSESVHRWVFEDAYVHTPSHAPSMALFAPSRPSKTTTPRSCDPGVLE